MRVQCRLLLQRIVFDHAMTDPVEESIKEVYEQLRAEADEQIQNQNHSKDLEPYEMR